METTVTQMRTTRTIGQALVAELQAVRARLHRIDQEDVAPGGLGRAGGDLDDLLDQAQAAVGREIDRLGRDRLAERARRLCAALDRLARGEYGRCEECEAPIATARLRAVPDAVRCVRCQEIHERVLATAGAP